MRRTERQHRKKGMEVSGIKTSGTKASDRMDPGTGAGERFGPGCHRYGRGGGSI